MRASTLLVILLVVLVGVAFAIEPIASDPNRPTDMGLYRFYYDAREILGDFAYWPYLFAAFAGVAFVALLGTHDPSELVELAAPPSTRVVRVYSKGGPNQGYYSGPAHPGESHRKSRRRKSRRAQK